MAFQYFLYNTLYNNTLVERSNNSFAPLPPNTGEIYSDFFVPEIQPLYYYRESGSTIILNDEETINEYLQGTAPPPTPDTNVTYGEFTGTTAILSATTSGLQMNKVNVSGDTMTGTLHTTNDFTAVGMVSGSTVCGGVWVNSPFICGQTKIQSPIITGGTCVTSPITCATTRMQSPVVCGSTCVTSPITCGTTRVQSPIICGTTCAVAPITCGSTCVTTPVLFGSTCSNSPLHCGACMLATLYVCSPVITGSTKVCSPIVCGTSCSQSPVTCGTTCAISPITIGSTCVCSPVVLGSTSMCSPTVCSSTCLCSTGTARFTGNVTAASTLNVSGATRIAGITNCEIAYANPATGVLTGSTNLVFDGTCLCVPFVKQTGGGAYFYAESTSIITNATSTCKIYLSGTPWNFQAGTYRVDINANVGNGSSNGCSLAKITCDGTSIHGSNYLLRSQTANFGFSVSVSRDMVFTAGCHCLAVYFWAGANTACVTYAAIRAARIC